MPNLKIKSSDGIEHIYQLIAWYPERGFALLQDKFLKRLVLHVELPALKQAGWRYATSPLTGVNPVEITPTRLVAPPCFATTERAVSARDSAISGHLSSTDEPDWEKHWLASGGDYLVLESEENFAAQMEFRDHLRRVQDTLRHDYDGRKRELESLRFGRPDYAKEMRFYGHLADCADSAFAAAYQREVRQLETVEIALFGKREMDDRKHSVGFLNYTVEDAKQDKKFITPYLQEKSAKANGQDLRKIEVERLAFLSQVRAHAVNGVVSKPNVSGDGTFQMPTLNLSNDEEMLLAAHVRWAMTFDDGSRVWLSKVHLRDARISEERDFDACFLLSPNPASVPAPASEVQFVSAKAVCEEFCCKMSTVKNYCKALNVQLDAITRCDVAEMRRLRLARQSRPHLKKTTDD